MEKSLEEKVKEIGLFTRHDTKEELAQEIGDLKIVLFTILTQLPYEERNRIKLSLAKMESPGIDQLLQFVSLFETSLPE